MITIIPLLIVSILSLISHAAYLDRGDGICAQAVAPSPGAVAPTNDIYEYTYIHADIGPDITLGECQDLCDAQADNKCIGTSFSATSTPYVMCLLHGLDGTGALFECMSSDHGGGFAGNSSGYANTGTIVINSNYHSSLMSNITDWKCYAKPSASASGDPHITSVYGCKIEAPVSIRPIDQNAVLMDCGNERIVIHYKRSWTEHIYRVDIIKDGVQKKYHFGVLRHAHHETVCGNKIEFHRYKLGISVHMRHAGNTDFTGLFADKSCL